VICLQRQKVQNAVLWKGESSPRAVRLGSGIFDEGILHVSHPSLREA